MVKSWFYTNKSDYGSPEHDLRDDAVEKIEISKDRKVLHLKLADFGKNDKNDKDKWLDRVYHITLPDTKDALQGASSWDSLQAYFTLTAIPNSK